jgi:hypothetical protein
MWRRSGAGIVASNSTDTRRRVSRNFSPTTTRDPASRRPAGLLVNGDTLCSTSRGPTTAHAAYQWDLQDRPPRR